MKEIHSMILDLFPDAVVDMTYKMPTYGYHHIESFKTKYPKIKTGKGCINFRDTDEIPISDLQDVVRHAIVHPKPRK